MSEAVFVVSLVAQGRRGRRQFTDYAVVVVGRQADLLEVVLTFAAGRRLAHLLDGGQQQADQHGEMAIAAPAPPYVVERWW